eukprot:TRINITY_DN2035_c0_g2_i7.p1 TRINITY_DN2035_c0_g2~~TRINITY_DN2035_c0_g2_i7.p1  ORF type:complete len:412 (-),score=99.96 TRINITY_DN2035_c0_g2_i7:205-1440(-)
MVEYLQKIPGVPPCPRDMNPASWMLDALSGTNSSQVAAKRMQLEEEKEKLPEPSLELSLEPALEPSLDPASAALAPSGPRAKPLDGPMLTKTLKASPAWFTVRTSLAELIQPKEGSKPVHFESQRARSWLDQFFLLMGRASRSYSRNVPLNYGRLTAILGLYILFGVIYYKLQPSDAGGVTSLVAAIFMTSAFAGMLNMNAVIPMLINQRAVFYREQSSYMYDAYTYALSNIVIELPWLGFILLFTLPCIYFMLGLTADAGIFFFHYLCTYALALVFFSIGQLVSTLMPSYETAQALAGKLAPLCFLFGGLFAPVPSMPIGTRWATYIDPITYGFRAIIPLHFYCVGSNCPSIEVPGLSGTTITKTYKYVQDNYYVDYDDRWTNWGYMLIFIGVLQVVVFICTKYKKHIVR